MSRYADFVERERAALLAGGARHDVPMVEGGPRWGAAAVLRVPASTGLAALAREAGAVAGPAHWVHDESVLHVTLRALDA